MKKIFTLAIISAFLLTGSVSCSKTNNSNAEVSIEITNHNKHFKISEENYNSFIDTIEQAIADNCVRGLELQQVISEQRINKYSSDGGYIQIDFNAPYEYELKSIYENDNKSLQVNQVFLLIDSDKNNSLIGIVSDNSSYVYHMSNQSADTIITYLTWT